MRRALGMASLTIVWFLIPSARRRRFGSRPGRAVQAVLAE
jgi:hypothetical protein